MIANLKSYLLSLIKLWAILVISLVFWCCQSPNDEIRDIALKIKTNQCRIQKITHYVDDSWTKSIDELGDFLPERLPEQERQNILNLKNANLIRMFESYEEFDPQGQALVDSMEQLDIVWADSLRNLSMENQNLEMKLDSLISNINEPATVDRLYEEVENIKNQECKDNAVM